MIFSSMKVTIITVCYNAETTIENCIGSVLGQTYKDIEYIIIDGKSTDHTVSLIEKYRTKISTIVSETDKGIYDAMNKGIALSTGDIVGILNADDVFANEICIEKIVKRFEETNAESLYADLLYVKGEKTIRYWKSGEYNKKKFFFGWMPPHPTFYVKKEAYQKFGKFDTSFRLAADYELMLRFLVKNNLTCCYLPLVTIKMSVGGISNKSLNNRLIANQEDKRAWSVNKLPMPFYLPFIKPLRKIFQYIIK